MLFSTRERLLPRFFYTHTHKEEREATQPRDIKFRYFKVGNETSREVIDAKANDIKAGLERLNLLGPIGPSCKTPLEVYGECEFSPYIRSYCTYNIITPHVYLNQLLIIIR